MRWSGISCLLLGHSWQTEAGFSAADNGAPAICVRCGLHRQPIVWSRGACNINPPATLPRPVAPPPPPPPCKPLRSLSPDELPYHFAEQISRLAQRVAALELRSLEG
jgi:hypothetical protein